MTVGLSSRMHERIRPFMSYGFDGNTTLSPGMWQSERLEALGVLGRRRQPGRRRSS